MIGCVLAITFACSDNPSSAPDPQIPDPVFGVIEVEVVTIGEDDDPDGYTVSIQGGETKEIEPNATLTFNQVTTGNKTVTLSGIPGHCTLNGSPSQAFTLGDNEVRTIQFEVSCSAIFRDKILFMRSTLEPFEYQIYSISPDGENQRMVSDLILWAFAAPSVSPDGLKVAFRRTESVGQESINEFGDIWVMNADGSDLQQLTNNVLANNFNPVWSPDGSKIAFSRTTPGANSDIFVMNADGSDVINLTGSNNTNDAQPFWSPDGSQIVFRTVTQLGNNSVNRAIKKMNANGSNLEVLIESDDGIIYDSPKWSPAGDVIAFEKFVLGGSGEPRQIHLMNSDGSNVRKLFMEAGYPNLAASFASWSPDGEHLAFSTVGGTAQNIFTININSLNIDIVTRGINRQHHINPSWSPFTRN